MLSRERSPALTEGTRLGRYELIRPLGHGGFAHVWLARLRGHAGFEKQVAIKVLQEHRQGDRQLRAMLRDEANILARLTHPNVATVHELGDEQGLLYVVMEYVAGGSLDALLVDLHALARPLPVAIGARMLMDIAEGLHAAHELAIDGRPMQLVHRDVSPQNVLLSEGGQCKLIDFGIAKVRERHAKETTTGVTKGKLAYMSPEHARAEALDRRADVWSLSAVAFELFEGHAVVPGESPIVVLRVLATEYQGPTFSATPAVLAPVLARGLARDPAGRPASARAFCDELEHALVSAQARIAPHAEVAAFVAEVRAAAARLPAPTEALRADDRFARSGSAAYRTESVARKVAPAQPGQTRWGRALIALLVLVLLVLVAAQLARESSPASEPASESANLRGAGSPPPLPAVVAAPVVDAPVVDAPSEVASEPSATTPATLPEAAPPTRDKPPIRKRARPLREASPPRSNAEVVDDEIE